MNKDINQTKDINLSQEEKLSLAMKQGNKPSISTQRLDANRWLLKKKLKARNYKQQSIVGRFLLTLATNKFQVVGMFLAFSFGFLLASNGSFLKGASQGMDSTIVSTTNESRNLNTHDQIVNFEISESKNGQPFNVSYTTIKTANIDANFNDVHSITILAAAMKSDLDDATRLKLISVLKDHLDHKLIRESLIHSLLFDPNPGVRIVAAESLAELSNDSMVRESLRQALLKDTNQGVRISAFNGLLQHLDEKTIETFKVQGAKEGNFYIRNKAKDIIEQSEKKNSPEQTI